MAFSWQGLFCELAREVAVTSGGRQIDLTAST
jgi:hypothetical protein